MKVKIKILQFALFLILLLKTSSIYAQQNTVGLITLDSISAYKGYTLFTPLPSKTTYLIDNEGYLIHSWESSYKPGQAVMLLENGLLLRTAFVPENTFNAGGAGGRIELIDWDGNLTWYFDYYSNNYSSHHDVEYMPNGNILLIAWEKKTYQEAVENGRQPNLINGEVWSEKIIEIEPTGSSGGNIVWEWRAWDHLIQDYDSAKPNYGIINKHPELINLNYTSLPNSDWLHINSIRYNPERDEILVSVHNFSEIWIIDHSTTTTEAIGHSGGNKGKGGDLLYRWGNPEAYDMGNDSNQKLFVQHDARWIDDNLINEDKILIFNNGQGRPGGNYSSVDQISVPLDSDGNYYLNNSGAFAPDYAEWAYTSQPEEGFFAQNISGATRLPNGNTLICNGPSGTFFEIDTSKNIVWEYINPVTANGILTQGETPDRNPVFKIYRYSADYPAFIDKDLSRKEKIELYPTSVDETDDGNISFKLSQNYPNPFNPSTKISFSIPSKFGSVHTLLTVYDVLGKKVDVLVNQRKQPGNYEIEYNTSGLASGVYIYKIQVGSYSLSKKMILQK